MFTLTVKHEIITHKLKRGYIMLKIGEEYLVRNKRKDDCFVLIATINKIKISSETPYKCIVNLYGRFDYLKKSDRYFVNSFSQYYRDFKESELESINILK